jgi:putative transposase
MSTRQLELDLRTHGGRRRGAGRKPKDDRPLVTHARRPRFDKPMPVHVTLKVRRDVPNLRNSRRFAAICRCFAASRGLHGLRLIEFSVLGDHLHLVVEAESNGSLSRGVQGLAVRLARALNRVLARTGRLFADHYHAHHLRTPTEVARTLRYVRDNAEHHYGEVGPDFFSSLAANASHIVMEAKTWLLCSGWRRSSG